MCYCKPNIRTPFCPDCGFQMWKEIEKLREELRLAKYDAEEKLGDCESDFKSTVQKYQMTIGSLNEEIFALKEELKNWKESATEFCNNMEYYRGLCDQVLGLFGNEAYISDDGSVQEEPLRAKMFELVVNSMALKNKQIEETKAEVERLKEENSHLLLNGTEWLRYTNELKSELSCYKQAESESVAAIAHMEMLYAHATKQLSRYEGAIEMEAWHCRCCGKLRGGLDSKFDCRGVQRVKVLVMKENE